MESVSDVLDRLAADIVKDLQGPNVTLQVKLEAFKILSARETALRKPAGRGREPRPEADDDDSDLPDFRTMQQRIRSVS